MKKLLAKVIATEGPYLQAIVEIEGTVYCVMDELTLDVQSAPEKDAQFEIEFSNLIDESESWESIFNGNPERKKCIEQIEGWKYRAFGEILSINPVKVDCGVLIEENVIYSNDPKVIGEYIGFTISRLGVYPI